MRYAVHACLRGARCRGCKTSAKHARYSASVCARRRHGAGHIGGCVRHPPCAQLLSSAVERAGSQRAGAAARHESAGRGGAGREAEHISQCTHFPPTFPNAVAPRAQTRSAAPSPSLRAALMCSTLPAGAPPLSARSIASAGSSLSRARHACSGSPPGCEEQSQCAQVPMKPFSGTSPYLRHGFCKR